jgi:electron transfer flavoprotein-quinone oxidoreductase
MSENGRPVAECDVVVVGAGPAGATAALALARAGRSVVLVERGPFPGSKNVYGGVVYGRVLDAIVPSWWETVPVERWVVRRSTMVVSGSQSLSVDYRSSEWGAEPYNGMTTLRARFDAWLAQLAVDAGARLLTSTVATGLRRDGRGRIAGVRTDRGGDIAARVVIACDGVNSFLAKEAGLLSAGAADHYTLGVKEVLALDPRTIGERFGVGPHEGVDIEILGATGDIPGGAFLYTNADSLSVGVVVSVPALAASGRRPEDVIADLKAHPAIAPLVHDGRLREYAAHLIPEGGYDAMPRLVTDGMLVAGDAAGMTLAAGIWLEGVNFAIGSGDAAGRAAVAALAAGDTTAAGLDSYRSDLESGFVLGDHKRLRRAPALVLSERFQRRYPALLCELAGDLFTVSNPEPKPGMLRLARNAARRHGVRLRDLAVDGVRVARTFG